MLHKEIPFLRICLPLCAGIVSGLYIKPDLLFLLIASFVIAGLFLISLSLNKYRDNLLFGIPVTLTLFICGMILYNNEKDSLSTLSSEPAVFSCILDDYPEEKTSSLMLTVKLKNRISPPVAELLHGSMLLYHKKDPVLADYLPGDELLIRCTPIELINRGNPYEFDYKFYMENLGIKYYAFTVSGSILSHNTPKRRNLAHKALIIRQKIIEMYKKRGISDERLPLVAALTLGEKSKLDREQKENFIKAGVMHIMAVSGLHAVILSLFVFNMLFFLKRKFNILRVAITILFLWSFAFVTGLTPSVLRATLMFTFIQSGNLMHRRVNGINSVLASAFVLILARPSVIFDAGFLLSYAAVIFIIAFYSDFYLKVHPKNRISDWIWQSAVVTIVAQLGTLPLTIMLFNRFPAYFLLTNIIIVPLSSLAIILGCLVPVLYPLKFLSGFLGSALDNLTGITEIMAAKAASLPSSSIENIGMTVPECILLFAFVSMIMRFALKKSPIPLYYPLFLLLLYLTAGTITQIFTKTTNELIVYNGSGSPAIGIRTGNVLNIFSDTLFLRPEVSRHSATLGLYTRMNLLKDGHHCIRAAGKVILVCSNPRENFIQQYNPDILIITGSRPGKNALSGKIPEKIILTTGNYASIPEGRLIHFIRKSGAYRVKL